MTKAEAWFHRELLSSRGLTSRAPLSVTSYLRLVLNRFELAFDMQHQCPSLPKKLIVVADPLAALFLKDPMENSA